jgi:hypothetical protein
LEANLGTLEPGPCRDLLVNVNQTTLTIFQSGTNLVFSFNNPQKTTLPGTIKGNDLVISREDAGTSGTADACRDPQAVHLDATVENPGGQRVLAGRLSILGCATCRLLPFRAMRQSSHGKEGH